MNELGFRLPRYSVRIKDTRTTERSDTLIHYGIKGQKWGIRRYQNEDGTLTEAGKARVAKAGLYKDPSKKSRHLKNRKEVIKEYNREWQKRRKEMFDENGKSSEANRELYDRFKDKYAAATLKYLGLRNLKKGRRDVKGILKDIDPDWDFRHKRDHDLSNTQLTEYRERRQKLKHPGREKAKRAAKKAKEVADVVSSVRKAVGL